MKERIRNGHRQDGAWICVPIAMIQTPYPGDLVHGPAYWLITEQDEVLFYKSYGSPQCNVNEDVVKHILSSYQRPGSKLACPPIKEIRLLTLSFVPHRCG